MYTYMSKLGNRTDMVVKTIDANCALTSMPVVSNPQMAPLEVEALHVSLSFAVCNICIWYVSRMDKRKVLNSVSTGLGQVL